MNKNETLLFPKINVLSNTKENIFQGNSSVKVIKAMGEEGIVPIIQNTNIVMFLKENLHLEMGTLIC